MPFLATCIAQVEILYLSKKKDMYILKTVIKYFHVLSENKDEYFLGVESVHPGFFFHILYAIVLLDIIYFLVALIILHFLKLSIIIILKLNQQREILKKTESTEWFLEIHAHTRPEEYRACGLTEPEEARRLRLQPGAAEAASSEQREGAPRSVVPRWVVVSLQALFRFRAPATKF
jgi:hypothetical protein